MRAAARSGSARAPSISATIAGSTSFFANGRFVLPTRARRSFCMATICLMTLWPSTRAPASTSSVTSWALASTMTIASSVPATSRFSWLFAFRSAVAGLMTKAPSQ